MKNIPETLPFILSYQSGHRPLPIVVKKVLSEWLPEAFQYPGLLDEIRNYLMDEDSNNKSFPNRSKSHVCLRQCLFGYLPSTDRGLVDDLFTILDGLKLAFEHFQLHSNEELDQLLAGKKQTVLPMLLAQMMEKEALDGDHLLEEE